MRHDFSKILTLNYIAINLEISDFEMSDKFLDPSIASHEVLLYYLHSHLCPKFRLASVAGAVIQATGRTELEDGLCAGGQLKARNGLQRVRTIPWNDRIPPYRGRCGPRPPGGRPNSNLAAVRASVVFKLQLVWC